MFGLTSSVSEQLIESFIFLSQFPHYHRLPKPTSSTQALNSLKSLRNNLKTRNHRIHAITKTDNYAFKMVLFGFRKYSDLQVRLFIIAHTSASKHRAAKATTDVLRHHYFRTTMSSDIKTFVRSCIYCLSIVKGKTVLRPFGPVVHGMSPNNFLHLD